MKSSAAAAGAFAPTFTYKNLEIHTVFLTARGLIDKIMLRPDNDCAGRDAMNALYTMLSGSYEVTARLPVGGKDYNDTLCMAPGLPICQRKAAPQER